MRLVRPCTSAPGFTCTPGTTLQLDMTKAKEALTRHGYRVVDAEVLLIAVRQEEVTIYPSGKLLIKTEDRRSAETSADEIYSILEDAGLM